MVRPQYVVLALATAVACSFDPTGGASSPVTAPSSGSSEGGETGDTGASTPTSEPTTGVGATSEGETGGTTTAVGPTSDPTTDASTSTGSAGCGDGVVDPGEACDGTELGGQSCEDFGLVDGVLACGPDCMLDMAGCLPLETCGDGVADPGEACDGEDLDQDCEGLGFDFGELVCAGNCTFDTAGCTAVADDWYDLAFLKRRKLTIPAVGVVGELTDFPVVISVTDMAVLQDLAPADGLVFAGVDKQVLAHEVELVDPARIIFWVELPAISDAVDAEFYVYYGNPAAMDTADPKATWSNGFLAVWHLDEMVVDEQESGLHADSTEGGHTGTQKDGEGLATGQCRVGRCQEIGEGDWIEVDKDGDFKLGNADATIAAWVYGFNANMGPRAIFAKSNPTMLQDGHVLFGQGGPNDANALGVEQRGAGEFMSNVGVTNSAWHQVVWTQTRDFMDPEELWRLYVDGEVVGETQITGLAAVGAHVARIGGPTPGSSFPGNFQGRIDEVQVSTDDRSPEWVRTAYNNQLAPGTFTLVGPEETF